jgi:hypothetical protein
MSDNNNDNDGLNFSSAEDFIKSMKARHAQKKKMDGMHARFATDGYADIAESMHIMNDEINRSEDLNVAAMMTVSRTFESVFRAFMKEADSGEIVNDQGRRFLMEAGIVSAGEDGCFHCAPGGVRLHDLQLVAGMSAMRFFLFSRMRKVKTSLPMIREVFEDGDPDTALRMLEEAMGSITCMMTALYKLGFELRDDHPVAIMATEGSVESKALMVRIKQAIKARDEGKK